MKKVFLTPIILSALTILASSCNMPGVKIDITPTIDTTQAYQTVEAIMTLNAAQAPSATLLPSPTNAGIITASPASTTATASPTSTKTPNPATPGKLCDQAAPGVPIDITIPDDTKMQPGQTFTKTWRLQNTGTCTWNKNYSIGIFSGEPMGTTTSVPLPNQVAPGQSVDISVDMVAPQTAGTYQSNWKLRNASNTWFGIGPDGSSPFWVRINVVGPTGTQTVIITPSTPTNTATPAIIASGSNTLILGDLLNLDTNQVNSGGEDLSYQLNQDNKPLLSPISGALIGVFGQGTPTQADCLATPLGALPLLLENLPQGLYLCYRTNQGLPGWARLLSFNATDATLGLQIQTWSAP